MKFDTTGSFNVACVHNQGKKVRNTQRIVRMDMMKDGRTSKMLRNEVQRYAEMSGGHI